MSYLLFSNYTCLIFCVGKNACQPEKQSFTERNSTKTTSIFAKSSSHQKRNQKIAYLVLGVVLSFLWLTPKCLSVFYRFSAKKITVNQKITRVTGFVFVCIDLKGNCQEENGALGSEFYDISVTSNTINNIFKASSVNFVHVCVHIYC